MSYSSLEFCCQIVMEVTFLQKYYAISYYCYKFCLHYFRRGAKYAAAIHKEQIVTLCYYPEFVT